MVENKEINLQTVFPSAYETNPVEIAGVIEKNLNILVSDHILSEEPTKVFVSERKGVNLFHPFFNTILEKHCLGSINLHKNSKIVIIKEFFNVSNKSILLIDKIEKEEAEYIQKFLFKSSRYIFKVCGYFAKKEDVNKLRKQFPEIFFIFKYEVDDSSYNDVNSKLISVYRTRITLNPPIYKISAEGEEDIGELIRKEILSEERTNVYIDNRIGIVLFHPFINSIIQKHNLSTINLNGKTSNYSIEPLTDANRKYILLTDAIGDGKEVGTILKTSKISLSKVCGYIAKKKGLVKLKKEFPEIDFKFILEVEDEKTYREALWRLTPVYHSRIEPLDLDHPFLLYILTSNIEKNDMKRIINDTCQKLSLGSIFTHEDELRSMNLEGYTVEIDNPNLFELERLAEHKQFYEIERLQLRFRFDLSKNHLRIMAFCSIIADVNHFSSDNVDCKNFLQERYCEKYEEIDGLDYQRICPQCIDTNMSISILNKIDTILKDQIQPIYENCRVHCVRKYDPFQDI